MVYDHHTHTTYSHGKGSIADNVRVAAAKGLKSIAITDHGPGHMTYGLDRAKIPQMRAEIAALKKEFPDMEILLGVEANTMRIEPYIDVPASERGDYNILLAGYHYGIRHAGMIANYAYKHAGFFRGEDSSLKVANTAMILDCLYFNEEAGNHIDVLTHPATRDRSTLRISQKPARTRAHLSKSTTSTHTLRWRRLKLPQNLMSALSSEATPMCRKKSARSKDRSDAHSRRAWILGES